MNMENTLFVKTLPLCIEKLFCTERYKHWPRATCSWSWATL